MIKTKFRVAVRGQREKETRKRHSYGNILFPNLSGRYLGY